MDSINYIEDYMSRLMYENPTYFNFDELEYWPNDVVDLFINNGLIKQIADSPSLLCDGCEEYCPMEVISLPGVNGRSARHFVACDKNDYTGRVSVDPKRLRRWIGSHKILAKVIVKLLGKEGQKNERVQ